jgi:hypothetical protein
MFLVQICHLTHPAHYRAVPKARLVPEGDTAQGICRLPRTVLKS